MAEQPLDYDSIENADVGDSDNLNLNKEKIMDILENSDMPEEMKDQLRNLYGDRMPKIFGYTSGTMLAVFFAALIFSVILFFGYKLYKSIKDKEVKKEEKKKLKQLKKKK